MRHLLLFLALSLSTLAFAGDRVIFNPDLNGDVKIKVNKNGTPTDAVVVSGTTGIPSFPNGALGIGAPVTLISNGDAEAAGTPAGWSTYDDGAVTEPVDGTGGSPSAVSPLLSTMNTGQVISGARTWLLVKGLLALGEGWSYSFTVPDNSGIRNSLNEISFSYYMVGDDATAGVADLLRVYVVDVTNGTLIAPSFTSCGGGASPSLATTRTTCNAKLSWVATTGTSYRLVFHVATSSTSVLNTYVDDLFVGQRGVQVGPGQGPKTAYTPNASVNEGIGTLSGSEIDLSYHRNGEYMVISGRFTAGTVSATPAKLAIPDGFTIATFAKSPQVVGKWAGGTTSGTLTHQGSVIATSGTNYVQFGRDAAESLASAFTPQNGSTLFESSQTIAVVNVMIPIAEWAGGVAYGENRVVYISDDGSSDVEGPAGSLVPNVAFSTSSTDRTIDMSRFNVQSSDDCQLQINYRGTNWTDASGLWPFSSGNNASSSNQYGTLGVWSTTTNYIARFGNQGVAVSASNASNGTTAWATEYTNGTRFRVKCVRGGVATAFGLATSDTPGLYEAGANPGITSNASAATGDVGEEFTTTWSTSSSTSVADTAVTVATLSNVTAGHWEIQIDAVVSLSRTSGTPVVELQVHDGTSVVARHLMSAAASMAFPVTIVKPLKTSATKTYTLRVVCNLAAANATALVYGTDAAISGTLVAPGVFVMRRVR